MNSPRSYIGTAPIGVVLLGISILAAGCTDGTPTSREILAHRDVSECILQGSSIQGIYVNYDVDSLVFNYATSIEDADQFWTLLEDRLKKSGWDSRGTAGDVRRFQRVIARSAEEVRIAYHKTKRSVTVAWVQADELGTVDDFEQTDESTFAKAVVWPRFESEIAR
ncbi:MAG: hypothetical protein HZA46_04520 [Planctomycetales bacterium]|nr:hypothetical protein [Planctomycetales bacterium]